MKKAFPLLVVSLAILAFCGGEILAHLRSDTIHNSSISDELNLLGVLATFVGAILAGAGIIVALVAITTMFNVDERLERQTDKLKEKIKREIKDETDEYFRGFDLRLQSLNMSDLETAEKLMQEAIERYPNQEASRSSMAFRLFGEVQRRFVNERRLLSNWGLGSIPFRQQGTGALSDEALRQLTMKWLDQALQHRDDPGGSVSLWRAELYGIWGQTNNMIQDLRLSVAKGILTTELYAANYYDVAPLLLAVPNETTLQVIGTILGQQLPMSEDKVLNYARTNVGRMGARIGEFLVKVKPGAIREKLPRDIYILSVGFGDVGFRISWPFIDQGMLFAGLPPQPEPEASDDEVWKLIDDRFWVIMPITDDLELPDTPDFGDDLQAGL